MEEEEPERGTHDYLWYRDGGDRWGQNRKEGEEVPKPSMSLPWTNCLRFHSSTLQISRSREKLVTLFKSPLPPFSRIISFSTRHPIVTHGVDQRKEVSRPLRPMMVKIEGE